MGQRFSRFMQGRYGGDQYGNFLVILAVVILVIEFFIPNYFVKNILNAIALLLLCYSYFRIFSRNYQKRYAENQKYLQKYYALRNALLKRKNRAAQRKTHRIFKCPSCKQAIRVPKGKGKIAIVCPKCNTEFIRRS
ncbi:MAG: hypothetical protein LUH14_05610 [Clostridiaceae bacterium]|nr:hypothetical protein [Clostridiaceae bacterium]